MPLIGRTIKDGDVISIIRKFLVSGIYDKFELLNVLRNVTIIDTDSSKTFIPNNIKNKSF